MWYRHQPTAEERKILDQAKTVRKLGREQQALARELREAVEYCERAQRAGWPANPERLQRVIEAAWKIEEVLARARAL